MNQQVIYQQIRYVIRLRFLFLFIKLGIVVLAHFIFNYHLPFVMVLGLFAFELILNTCLLLFYRTKSTAYSSEYSIQLIIEIALMTLLLYLTGGASNPFISVLLLPIAIASVSLSQTQLLRVAVCGLIAYGLLMINNNAMHTHNMNMQQHLFGMWVNFIFSVIVIVLVISKLINTLRQQEQQVSAMREKQLRQEQLVALGLASVQFSHQMATPLASLSLLEEEFAQGVSDPDLVNEFSKQLGLCQANLEKFRQLSTQVKANEAVPLSVANFYETLSQEVRLNFSHMQCDMDFTQQVNIEGYSILSDLTLMPALFNVIQNAVMASLENQQKKITIDCELLATTLTLKIRDFGPGMDSALAQNLGLSLFDSQRGLGMGVMLSHASLERLGGRLEMINHTEQGMIALIQLDTIKQ